MLKNADVLSKWKLEHVLNLRALKAAAYNVRQLGYHIGMMVLHVQVDISCSN